MFAVILCWLASSVSRLREAPNLLDFQLEEVAAELGAGDELTPCSCPSCPDHGARTTSFLKYCSLQAC